MEAIYAPWRSEYIRGEKPEGCIFCKDSILQDEFVLFEGKTCFVMLNRYPYSSGHLMVIPYRHLSRIQDLSDDEKMELFNLLDLSVRALNETIEPHGFNLGINLGKAAGAGVEAHLHVHIVPRWNGDTNFMTVVGESRVISEDLTKIRNKLLPVFKTLSQED